jgi:hypothetical protein
MSATEKLDGHRAEKSTSLHDVIKTHFKFDDIVVSGKNNQKKDYTGIKNGLLQEEIHFSNKFAINSTQVWLPSHIAKRKNTKTLFDYVPGLIPVQDKLVQWLGTISNKNIIRTSWTEIPDWIKVEECLNLVTKDQTLLIPMLLQLAGDTEKIKYITWLSKKQGGITIIDAEKYVEYLSTNCYWKTTRERTTDEGTIKLIDRLTNKTMIHLQRSGNGPISQKIKPLFHMHPNWPKELEVYSDSSFKITL